MKSLVTICDSCKPKPPMLPCLITQLGTQPIGQCRTYRMKVPFQWILSHHYCWTSMLHQHSRPAVFRILTLRTFPGTVHPTLFTPLPS